MTTERFPIDDDFAWAQRLYIKEIERQYNRRKPVRIIVLKARQLGISTATEGVLFYWSFLHPGTNGLVIAHETEASSGLFEKTKMYWETWPFKPYYSLKYSTKRNMHWLETRSNLRVATAKNVQSGRGSTIHAVHASECAFYDDPRTLMIGLNQTIPNEHGTIVVLESTANGVGNWFHEQWQQAELGDSDYVALFFPWFLHPEYQVPTTLCTKRELDPDERKLLKLPGMTYENLAWRRWAIINRADGDMDNFMQEYPATPEEAFITTGNPVFPHAALDDCFIPKSGAKGMLIESYDGSIRFIKGNGNLTIFKTPSKTDLRHTRYFVAGDPSMAVDGDPASIQVIHRGTYEQVATWHGYADPLVFADEMIKIGKFYNNAMLSPESQGGGQATISRILTKNYPNVWQHRWADKLPGKLSVNYGWYTNYERKRWAIGLLTHLIADNSITIHDRRTYNELRNYVVHPNGELGNADLRTHDDCVMALAIAVVCSSTEQPFSDYIHNPSPVIDLFSQYSDEDGQNFG